jgi:hypothetical protein
MERGIFVWRDERSCRISIRSQYTGSYVKEPKFRNLMVLRSKVVGRHIRDEVQV